MLREIFCLSHVSPAHYRAGRPRQAVSILSGWPALSAHGARAAELVEASPRFGEDRRSAVAESRSGQASSPAPRAFITAGGPVAASRARAHGSTRPSSLARARHAATQVVGAGAGRLGLTRARTRLGYLSDFEKL